MLALDLDSLASATQSLRLLKHNRPALLSIYDRDHGAHADAPLKPQIENKLHTSGVEWNGGRITLLTMPRLFNYVFNPLSVYFCWRAEGDLAAIVYEVSNTFGERHFYVLRPSIGADGAISQTCAKDFFVSPFLEQDLRYEFRILPPGERVSVAVLARRGASIALAASFSGRRQALNDAQLIRAWLGNPLMSLKVIAGIHWEALLMLLKGIPFIGRKGPGAAAASPR